MAVPDFILQAVTSSNHADLIKRLLRFAKPEQVLVSVAYVRTSGLDEIEKELKVVFNKIRFFVGIRNDITSVQAIKRLLAMDVELYAVDTGSRKTIFHPKVYLTHNDKEAYVIIGSANMTFGGLYNNIEASTAMKLDLIVETDRKFVKTTLDTFSDLIKNHPQHVFKITSPKQANELFESGRLADETIIPAPSTTSGVKRGKRDDLPPMKLKRIPFPKGKLPRTKPSASKIIVKKAPVTPPPASVVGYRLVWESKGLNERDLNIPSGINTAPTGSMGFKKGGFDDIDQRHYFRDEVFHDLVWTIDKPSSKWERAQAKFELVIKNLNYGFFNFKLSHYTDKKSRSYQQKNFMTQLHWGDVKEHIAKDDLLGRILYLYRKDVDPPEFIIEID